MRLSTSAKKDAGITPRSPPPSSAKIRFIAALFAACPGTPYTRPRQALGYPDLVSP